MNGWILYYKKRNNLDAQEDYAVLRLLEAAEAKGINLELFAPEQLELIVSRSDEKSILVDGIAKPIPDFILPRLGSRSTYFTLAILRQLEKLGVYSCNSSESIEIVKDKLHLHQILAQSNFPTPKTMLLKFPANVDVVRKELGFPVVIKNITGMKGQGIYLCQTEEEFIDLMELIQSNNPHANIILQEFIESSKGKDLRVFVLGGKVIGCMKRSTEKGFKANISRGGSASPFELSPEAEWLAIETARLVDLDIAGIDLLFDEHNSFKVCEANSAPGFTGLEKVVGRNIAEQILDYIMIKVQGHINAMPLTSHAEKNLQI